MRSFRRRLRGCTWLAVLAMLTLALGPTISRLTLPEQPSRGSAFGLAAPHAEAAMHDAAMATASTHAHHHRPGPLAATEAPASPPGLPAHRHTLEHCALCVVAASAFAVAPAPPTVVAQGAVRHDVTAPAERGLAPGRTPWSPATSRGPPDRA